MLVIHLDAFENVVCEMAAILSRGVELNAASEKDDNHNVWQVS